MNSDAGWVCLAVIVVGGLVEIARVAAYARRRSRGV